MLTPGKEYYTLVVPLLGGPITLVAGLPFQHTLEEFTVSLLSMTNQRNKNRFGLSDEFESKTTIGGFGLEIQNYSSIEVLSGTGAGPLVDSTELPAQRLSVIRFGTISPQKYNAMMEVNPQLISQCDVQFVRLYEPRETNTLELYVRPRAKVDLAELQYLIRLYLLD
jgi:hypothetical protein